jgi:quercetin dioxygenase-like cupin family protein
MSILTQLSLTAIVALSLNAAADEPKAAPQAQRTVLERHDQSGVPGKEIVIGSAMLPAGTAIGYHTHPGDEAGYVLQGFLILKVRGQPDRRLYAGNSFFIPLGAVQASLLPRARTAELPYPRGSLTKASRWQPRFPDYREEIIDKSETLT